ncbi:palmitoyl-acyl carrier protein thioesterase, chloroplastic [Ricinus communis]|uniref:Acyl-[acyl-carrier-protein] hydrolase n=1 Tax=Ricinus communis TaxID=3988 RepID=B9SJZ2_RICCO|nr:palmitoyl-acyl carrier protein thioesterase, chloroplastic [Ricinus communis]EEF36100.1 palmitoyl-acyl carrier protein thioesterase [Ricinus communis]|eukprot:XP_002526311.1 palmitoyl-acyl carrier protein thioesterase, chloroplastic [Ricinus communis]
MGTCSYTITLPIRCLSNSNGHHDPHKQNLNKIKINGASTSTRPLKLDAPSQTVGVATIYLASVSENLTLTKEVMRQNIPTKKQYIDPHRQGLMIEGGVGYRQTIVIRSYEVGPDKTATLESILYLLQETALNHVWLSGLLSNGFGATHGMVKNNLIWVVSKLQVQVDHYPIWGEVVEIDTWVRASGKNGMKRDWLIRSQATGHVFVRATSTWVMMNEKTRRLSKMPEEVRAEISPWFIEKQAIKEEVPDKIAKLDDKARYVISNLKPKRSDLDMNHHVNNVKYVRWMLEILPDHFLESHQLSGITMEYRRECGSADIVQSLCEPDGDEILSNDIPVLNGFSLASEPLMEGNGFLVPLDKVPLKYTHLLLTKGESQNEEIVRGKTIWKKKLCTMPFST